MCVHASHFVMSRDGRRVVTGFREQPDGLERVEGDLAWDGVERRNCRDRFALVFQCVQ